MSEQDYYQVLGVSKTATDAEIKKAYRKLAMKYHPDHSKGDKRAEEMFKKVSEAYAVLSDKEKRQQYDTFGSTGFHQRYSQEDIQKCGPGRYSQRVRLWRPGETVFLWRRLSIWRTPASTGAGQRVGSGL